MARPKSHTSAVCQNEGCSFYRKEKGKDIEHSDNIFTSFIGISNGQF